MTDEDYKKINSEISKMVEYASKNEPFLYKNIDKLYDAAMKCYNEIGYKKLNFLGPLPSISKQEIYKIAKEFLFKIKPEYAITFQETLDNGIIIYHSPVNRETSSFNFTDNIMFFDIAKHDNLIEVRNWIHEFFHRLNVAPDIEKETDSPSILSEFVSIFFEYMFLEFLIDKGYSPYDIELVNQQRKLSFVGDAYTICISAKLFSMVKDGEEINKELIEKKFAPGQMQAIEENLMDIEEFELCKNDILNYKHFFGTLLANYVYKIDGTFEEKAKKMSYINDNMGKMTRYEIFDYLGIKNDENLNQILVDSYVESEKEVIGINKI